MTVMKISLEVYLVASWALRSMLGSHSAGWMVLMKQKDLQLVERRAGQIRLGNQTAPMTVLHYLWDQYLARQMAGQRLTDLQMVVMWGCLKHLASLRGV